MYEQVGLILVPSIGPFFFFCFALSNFSVMIFVLSYFILLRCVLLSFRSLFFLHKRQKESGLGWKGGRKT